MKVIRTYTLDYDIARELEGTKNASGLINELLINHFKINTVAKKAHEEKILAGAKEKMNEEDLKTASTEENKKVEDFLEQMDDWTEYREGIKKNKWKGAVEYAKKKMGL